MSTLEVVLTSSVIATLVSALVSVVIGWLRDRNLAQFKDDLRNEAFKRETKFVNLHEKRAEMIADIYRLLAIAQDNVERAILPLPVTPDKRGDSAFKAFWELKQSFNQNRIFFSSSQCTKLDELLKLIGVRWLTAHQYRKEVEDESTREFIQARSKEAAEKLPPLLEELEIDFRKILGFDLTG